MVVYAFKGSELIQIHTYCIIVCLKNKAASQFSYSILFYLQYSMYYEVCKIRSSLFHFLRPLNIGSCIKDNCKEICNTFIFILMAVARFTHELPFKCLRSVSIFEKILCKDIKQIKSDSIVKIFIFLRNVVVFFYFLFIKES